MKPAPFAYRRPADLPEALAVLAEVGDDAKALAGGQSLIPLLAMRLAQPAVVVDLEHVAELRGVERDGDRLRIRAMTRQSTLERDDTMPPLIREAVRHIGHFQIRSRGTVGGSLAHADPAAEWPALALAMDAHMVVASKARGERAVPASEFFVGPLMTVLEPDELLVEVVIEDAAAAAAFAEVERRAGDFALVGAVSHGGRLVVFGTGSRPQRLPATEDLARQAAPLPELTSAARNEIEAVDDIHAPAAYRKSVGAELVAEVWRRAIA